jgi:hypothetical protein
MDQAVSPVMERDPGSLPRVGARVIDLNPRLFGSELEFRAFCRSLAKTISLVGPGARHQALEEARDEIQVAANGTSSKRRVALNFACSIVIDMVAQGWQLTASRGRVQLQAPEQSGASQEELKQSVRDGHLIERNSQLREPSVREFVRGMEQKRLGPKGWVSIFSLMRDGRDLVHALRRADQERDTKHRAKELRGIIAPYLQVVERGTRCEHTGLELIDIWRYFRHTWVSTYKSLPGRSMMILVRDAALPYHPIIGIAALGSSMAQQSLRDQWIGWDSETFAAKLECNPTARMARWVDDAVRRLIKAVYLKDLIKGKVFNKTEIRSPTKRTITRLLREAQKASGYHLLNPDAANHKNSSIKNSRVKWEIQAKSPLFKAKRARSLAKLLEIRMSLKKSGFKRPTTRMLSAALTTTEGRKAVKQLVRIVKAEHVGVNMMDIIVCGAVAPYNVLLGGKLVCLLLTSPEVVGFYRSRYEGKSSIIASSMKGSAVVRPPNLVLLATTSLYGVNSSQYNRIRVPLEDVGGRTGQRLEYIELGASCGYGSYHFSKATIDYLETLLGRAGDGRKVNSIFGEGVNPLMRKIRGGLAQLSLPEDELLRHGNTRLVYGVPLAMNFREVLLGLARRPHYFLNSKDTGDATEHLAEFWRNRWLSGRITRPGILESVEGHTLSYPVTHGARVILPPVDQEDGLAGIL